MVLVIQILLGRWIKASRCAKALREQWHHRKRGWAGAGRAGNVALSLLPVHLLLHLVCWFWLFLTPFLLTFTSKSMSLSAFFLPAFRKLNFLKICSPQLTLCSRQCSCLSWQQTVLKCRSSAFSSLPPAVFMMLAPGAFLCRNEGTNQVPSRPCWSWARVCGGLSLFVRPSPEPELHL